MGKRYGQVSQGSKAGLATLDVSHGDTCNLGWRCVWPPGQLKVCLGESTWISGRSQGRRPLGSFQPRLTFSSPHLPARWGPGFLPWARLGMPWFVVPHLVWSPMLQKTTQCHCPAGWVTGTGRGVTVACSGSRLSLSCSLLFFSETCIPRTERSPFSSPLRAVHTTAWLLIIYSENSGSLSVNFLELVLL